MPLLLLALLVLVATALGIAQTRSVGGVLDPRSAEPAGGRALAALLGDRGVDVRRTTDAAALTDATTERTVVLLPFPRLLGDAALGRLGALAYGTVALVGPAQATLGRMTGEVSEAGDAPTLSREPGCPDPAATAAGVAVLGGTTYATTGGVGCYADEDGEATLVVARTTGGARLVVLGDGEPLRNDALTDEGNAALALNLLGADGSADEVRWLVPTPGGTGDEDAPGILPGWVGPAALQLLLAGLLAALWRGRRLGPPVTEPLPVVVRAAETVEGRARLYRRAQARDLAAAALRSGALARLVLRLGIDAGGGEPAPAAVVAAVAARSGRPDAEVAAVLYGPPPADDAGLVRLAGALDSVVHDTLEEVRQP